MLTKLKINDKIVSLSTTETNFQSVSHYKITSEKFFKKILKKVLTKQNNSDKLVDVVAPNNLGHNKSQLNN